MELLFCPHCNKEVQYSVVPAGQHQKAICIECDRYIKFLPQALEKFEMPFGKHKGELLIDAVKRDKRYFEWLLSQDLKRGILKDRIELLLHE